MNIRFFFNCFYACLSIIFLYLLDSNITLLTQHTKKIEVLSEEVMMLRNYHNYQKINSNSFVFGYINCKDLYYNPMYFALFFLNKNEKLQLIDKQYERCVVNFIANFLKPEFVKKIMVTEKKILHLMSDDTNVADMAIDIFFSILRRHNFDVILYENKLADILENWYITNQFILAKHHIKREDLEDIKNLIILYKLSEVVYL